MHICRNCRILGLKRKIPKFSREKSKISPKNKYKMDSRPLATLNARRPRNVSATEGEGFGV